MAGTAIHIYQGSVDSVVNLEDYRDKKGSGKNYDALNARKKIRGIFDRAYFYLTAAGEMYGNLSIIYESALDYKELYRIAAKIITDEFSQKPISSRQGAMRKYYAGASTPAGFENDPDSLLEGYQKIYLINDPVGAGSERILDIFSGSAVYRGFHADVYYSPKKPAAKPEHLLIPGLGVAFVTSTLYHTIPRSALKTGAEVVTVDLKRVFHAELIRRKENILRDGKRKMGELLEKGAFYLSQANREQELILRS